MAASHKTLDTPNGNKKPSAPAMQRGGSKKPTPKNPLFVEPLKTELRDVLLAYGLNLDISRLGKVELDKLFKRISPILAELRPLADGLTAGELTDAYRWWMKHHPKMEAPCGEITVPTMLIQYRQAKADYELSLVQPVLVPKTLPNGKVVYGEME